MLKKEGFFYVSRGKGAEILHELLGFRLSKMKNGTVMTGGPLLDPITDVLAAQRINYVVVEADEVIRREDFENNGFDERTMPEGASEELVSLEYRQEDCLLVEMLEALLKGADPYTGEVLENGHILCDENMKRIFMIAQKKLADDAGRKKNAQNMRVCGGQKRKMHS